MSKGMNTERRVKALERMDFDELKSMIVSAGNVINARNAEEERDIVLGSGHKARCSSPQYFTKEQITESHDWLVSKGWEPRTNMDAAATGDGEVMQ